MPPGLDSVSCTPHAASSPSGHGNWRPLEVQGDVLPARLRVERHAGSTATAPRCPRGLKQLQLAQRPVPFVTAPTRPGYHNDEGSQKRLIHSVQQGARLRVTVLPASRGTTLRARRRAHPLRVSNPAWRLRLSPSQAKSAPLECRIQQAGRGTYHGDPRSARRPLGETVWDPVSWPTGSSATSWLS
jgi:hypothetical protein